MIRVNSSAASSPNIEIICEELVFVGGTKYDWSEKSVRIRCRKIFLLPNDKKPVKFDLSGRNGADPPNKAAVDAKPEEIQSTRAQAPGLGVFKREVVITGYMTSMKDEWNAAKYDEDKPPKPAQKGRDGIKGLPGERGHDSGSFELLTEEVDESVLQQGIAFVLTCNGGKGGNGQDGQDGVEGGAGLDYVCDNVRHYETNHLDESVLRMLFGTPRPTPDVYNNILHVFLGAPGGVGGNGGPGGRGGNSGSVNISPDALKAIFQISNNCGDKGTDGSDGQTGDHGKHSESKVFQNSGWTMWSWKHYADDLDEKLADEKKLSMVIHEWATNKTEPEVPTKVSVNNLKGDDLWALYEPGQQQAATAQGAVTIHNTDISDLHRGYTRDASFLQKILDRLRFEHFMHLTCQPYSLYSARVPGPAVTQMKMLKDWMIRVFHDIGLNDQSPLIRSLYLSYTALAHAYISTPAVDAFNNSISYVPWIPSADAFEKTLADFETVEKWYNESAAMLASQAQQRDVLQKKIDDARGKVFASTQEIEKQQTKAAQLADLFKEAAGNVEEARQQLARAVEAFKDRIEQHVECKLETVLESLSSALMFTDAENSAAVGGALLSVSVGAVKTVHESFGQIGGVNKSLLIARMDVTTKASKDLKDEIAKTVNDNA